jgi:nucleotide-binding universal stress UspA family protein
LAAILTGLKQFRHMQGNCFASIARAFVSLRNSAQRNRRTDMSPETLSPKLILVPVDFSGFSRNAVDAAAELASRFGAQLLLVHVVPAIPELPESVSIFKEGEYDQSLRDTAAQRLSDLAASLAGRNLVVRTELGNANDVGTEIVRIAERDHADMIVIATHGMTGWRRIAFGSVAKEVVEEAACPVLVLRAQESHQSAESHAASSSASA